MLIWCVLSFINVTTTLIGIYNSLLCGTMEPTGHVVGDALRGNPNPYTAPQGNPYVSSSISTSALQPHPDTGLLIANSRLRSGSGSPPGEGASPRKKSWGGERSLPWPGFSAPTAAPIIVPTTGGAGTELPSSSRPAPRACLPLPLPLALVEPLMGSCLAGNEVQTGHRTPGVSGSSAALAIHHLPCFENAPGAVGMQSHQTPSAVQMGASSSTRDDFVGIGGYAACAPPPPLHPKADGSSGNVFDQGSGQQAPSVLGPPPPRQEPIPFAILPGAESKAAAPPARNGAQAPPPVKAGSAVGAANRTTSTTTSTTSSGGSRTASTMFLRPAPFRSSGACGAGRGKGKGRDEYADGVRSETQKRNSAMQQTLHSGTEVEVCFPSSMCCMRASVVGFGPTGSLSVRLHHDQSVAWVRIQDVWLREDPLYRPVKRQT